MRAVVVGAGVGGLAVAARLATQGHAVTLLEAAPVVGGKLGEVVHEGFRFDTGPSLLTYPEVFQRLFADTGGWPADLVLERVDPLFRYRFADGSRLDWPHADEQWDALMRKGRRVWEVSLEHVLSRELRGPRSLARLALTRPQDLAAIAPGRTLRQAGRALDDPRLRQVLDRYATYTGSDPRRAPAALLAVPWVEQAHGGWYVRGGLRRLADALLQRCLERGVDVRVGTRATRVVPRSHVETDQGRFPADVVVSDVDARHLYAHLVPGPVPRAEPSLSAYVLLLALRGSTPGLAHHTVLFPSDYDAEMDAVFGGRRPEDPTLYLSRPPDAAPDGHEAVFVLANAPAFADVDWSGYDLLDVLARRGVDVRDRVLWSQVLTPADLQAATGAVGGAIYGSSSNGVRAAFLRPRNRSPVPGLWLVGGSAHPGGGLPMVALSAEVVARALR